MALKFLCFLSLVAFASAAATGRLSGGRPIDIQDAKYAVSIIYNYPRPRVDIQRCVGSLISSWHVITTAYCFRGANLNNMRVQAGSSHSLTGGPNRAVSHFVAHPQYQQIPRTNDIAVLFLAAPFHVGGNTNIDVLHLPAQNYPINPGKSLRVVGWGFPIEQVQGGRQLTQLHAIQLTTVSEEQCRAAWEEGHANLPRSQRIWSYPGVVHIDHNSFCAGANGQQGLCTGDSGAPVVEGNVLVGVAVDYFTCFNTIPDFFTRVPNFTEWILSVTGSRTYGKDEIPIRIAQA